MVLPSGQDLHLGIQGLMDSGGSLSMTDSGGNLSMTEQEGPIEVVIDCGLGIMGLGEMIGTVIDRGQLQDLQDRHLLLGALGVGAILVAK